MQNIDELEQDLNSLALEKQDIIEQNRRLNSQLEVLLSERSSMELQVMQLRKDKEDFQHDTHDLREQIT